MNKKPWAGYLYRFIVIIAFVQNKKKKHTNSKKGHWFRSEHFFKFSLLDSFQCWVQQMQFPILQMNVFLQHFICGNVKTEQLNR